MTSNSGRGIINMAMAMTIMAVVTMTLLAIRFFFDVYNDDRENM
jgi:hypothetical protein